MSFRVNSSLGRSVHGIGSDNSWATVPGAPASCQLTIAPVFLWRIVAHMRRCLPVEGVGLLATTRSKDELIADAYYPGTNVAESVTRFRMNPQEVHRAIDDMKRRKTHLGAVIHSHPTTAAEPSPIDLREANLPDALAIIVGFEPLLSIRAWRLLFTPSGKAFDAVECPIHTTVPELGTQERSRTLDEWLKT